MCETSASITRPPLNGSGPRRISITPRPRSYSVAFAPGNGIPWSVVKMISVSSTRPDASSSLSTMPTPWSSERALALNAATSARTSGVSGRLFGGFE